MTIQAMIDKFYNGDRKVAAQSAGVSPQHLNNWISKGYQVERLADGRFILVTTKSQIFNSL